MTEERPLFGLSTEELHLEAERALKTLAQVLDEAVERTGAPGTRLFQELKDRRPRPGHLDPPDADRVYSVYVIELDPVVLEKGAFRRAKRRYVDGKPCVYVGMTFHSPEYRFEQHKTGDGAAKYVREFGLRLRPDLYEDRNPLTKREARIEERALAIELREEGYGAWQN